MILVILHNERSIDELASQVADKFPTVKWYHDERQAITNLRRGDVPDLIVADRAYAKVRDALDPYLASKFVVLSTFSRKTILDAFRNLR